MSNSAVNAFDPIVMKHIIDIEVDAKLYGIYYHDGAFVLTEEIDSSRPYNAQKMRVVRFGMDKDGNYIGTALRHSADGGAIWRRVVGLGRSYVLQVHEFAKFRNAMSDLKFNELLEHLNSAVASE